VHENIINHEFSILYLKNSLNLNFERLALLTQDYVEKLYNRHNTNFEMVYRALRKIIRGGNYRNPFFG